jgi:hypothetical protein
MEDLQWLYSARLCTQKSFYVDHQSHCRTKESNRQEINLSYCVGANVL